jgi:hypothetical protein
LPDIPVDLVAAITAFLAANMASQFQVSPSNGGVYADYALQQLYPYAVVTDDSEDYGQIASAGMDSPEFANMCLERLNFSVSIYATSKAQARLLTRQAILLICNFYSAGAFTSEEGNVLEIRPVRSQYLPLDDTGTLSATVFRRGTLFQASVEFTL